MKDGVTPEKLAALVRTWVENNRDAEEAKLELVLHAGGEYSITTTCVEKGELAGQPTTQVL